MKNGFDKLNQLIDYKGIFMSIEGLTPKQIVEKLDSYIIGQDKAKKAVAVALRNRIRRIHCQKIFVTKLRQRIFS